MAKRKTSKRSESTASGPLAFQHLMMENQYAALLESLQKPLPLAIRINPLKVTVDAAIQKWKQEYGWEIRPVPFCPAGYWIDKSVHSVSLTWEHRLGHYYIQDAASMLPVELFDFPLQQDALVLDMAASPGGKTTHLAARLKDRTVIVANDSSTSRLTALRLVLRNWGAANVGVTRYAGEQFGEMCPGLFDVVLLDAPCSMQGLRSSESHPMRSITTREQASLALRQQRLLESAVLATKPGGQIVYSTCTLSSIEDEGVVDAVLKGFGNTLRLENISSQMPLGAQGVTRDHETEYSQEMLKAARIWPHIFNTAGFFAARFTKLDGETRAINSLQYHEKRFSYSPIPYKTLQELQQQWITEFGFNLVSVLSLHNLAVIQTGRELHAVPCWILSEHNLLAFQNAGLPLAESTPDGFQPAHDWVARFEKLFTGARIIIPAEQVSAWLRGSDLPEIPSGNFSTRRVVLVVDEKGKYLGLAKILPNRLRNLLPRSVVSNW